MWVQCVHIRQSNLEPIWNAWETRTQWKKNSFVSGVTKREKIAFKMKNMSWLRKIVFFCACWRQKMMNFLSCGIDSLRRKQTRCIACRNILTNWKRKFENRGKIFLLMLFVNSCTQANLFASIFMVRIIKFFSLKHFKQLQ